MKKSTKYLILSVSIFVISIVYVAYRAEGEIKPYYSGDAVYVNGKVIFGSMNNDGVLELFQFSNNAIQRGAVIKSSDSLLPKTAKKRVYDFALINDGGKAYVYTAEGKKMSKYDISNINTPVFIKQVVENSGDWYIGLRKYDGRLATIGTKEMKLWNYDLQNIDSFKILNNKSYNIGISDDGKNIFNIGTTSVNIFDTVARRYTTNPGMKIADNHFRKSYFDVSTRKLYVVDDEKLNAFTLNGDLADSYKHISSNGYDVDAVQGGSYLYMTDGLGVVKLNKFTLDQVKWSYTTNANGKKGGWAMGLNVVGTDSGDKLVVFNNSNIIVMDSNLKVLGSVDAIDESNVAFIEEPLSLRLDRTSGVAATPVLVSGTGYSYNEDLIITFANKTVVTKTDANGRFRISIDIPSVLPTRTDIKVVGKASGLSYSTAFEIR